MLSRMLRDEQGTKLLEFGLTAALVGIAATIATLSVVLI